MDVATTGLPRSFGRNVSINYVAAAVAALSTLLMTPVLIRYLGTSGYGAWTIIGSVLAYLELFELGFGVATIKFVAEDAFRDPRAVNRTINTNAAALAVFGGFALVACLAMARWVPGWFHVPEALSGEVVISFVIIGVALAISIPGDVLGGGLAGHQRYDLLSISNLVTNLATVLAGVLVVVLGGGLIGLAVVTATLAVAAQALRYAMLRRIMPELSLSWRHIDRSRLRLTAETSGWFLLRDLTNVVINRMDLIVVGAFLGVNAVAVYAVALKLSQLGQKAMIPLLQVFFPHASALSVTGPRRALAALLVDGTRVALLVASPIMLMLILLGEDVLQVWLGDAFQDAVPVLAVLAVSRGLQSVSDTAWWLLAGAGVIRTTALIALVESAVNIAASIVLVQAVGVIGAALGTLLGVALIGTPTALWLGARHAESSAAEVWRRSLLPHLLPSVLMAAVLVLAANVMSSPVWALVIGGLAGVAVYLVTYYSTAPVADREQALRLVRRLTRRPRSTSHDEPHPALEARYPGGDGPVRVAVCIASRRRPQGLRLLLSGLAGQHLCLPAGGRVVMTVVVVDNDDDLDGLAVVRTFADRLDVRGVHEPVTGISFARNRAIAEAGPGIDAFAFIDDDEVPVSTWLRDLVVTALRHDASIVMGPVRPQYPPATPRWVRAGAFHRRLEHVDGQLLDYARTSNVLVCAEAVLHHAEPFPQRMALTGGEDTFFFARAAAEGHEIRWSAPASVTEFVPASRTRIGWLVRREFRRGSTLSVVVSQLSPTPGRLVRRLGRGVVEMALGLILSLVGVVLGRVGVVRGLRRTAFGLGLVIGLTGWQIREYRNPSDDVG